jgi:hypothetical protein
MYEHQPYVKRTVCATGFAAKRSARSRDCATARKVQYAQKVLRESLVAHDDPPKVLPAWRGEAAVDKRFLQIQIAFVEECLG